MPRTKQCARKIKGAKRPEKNQKKSNNNSSTSPSKPASSGSFGIGDFIQHSSRNLETPVTSLKPNPSAVALYDVANHEKVTEKSSPSPGEKEQRVPTESEKIISDAIEKYQQGEDNLSEKRNSESLTGIEEDETEIFNLSNDRKRQKTENLDN